MEQSGFVLDNPRLKFRVSIKDMIQVLNSCSEVTGIEIPNRVIHELKTIGDLFAFFERETRRIQDYRVFPKLEREEKIPENLSVLFAK